MDIKDYLIHSYLYYELDASIISDGEFDKLCNRLLVNWPNQQSIWKKYISKDDLKAGTGFTLFYNKEMGKRDFPAEIVEEAQTALAKYRATAVMEYQTSTDNPDELYADLKDAADWFLIGIEVDYVHFYKENPVKKQMCLDVLARIWKERKNDKAVDPDTGCDPVC
jgi:hypothetical protein